MVIGMELELELVWHRDKGGAVPKRYCALPSCALPLHRKRFANGVFESLAEYRRRRHCNAACMGQARWVEAGGGRECLSCGTTLSRKRYFNGKVGYRLEPIAMFNQRGHCDHLCAGAAMQAVRIEDYQKGVRDGLQAA